MSIGTWARALLRRAVLGFYRVARIAPATQLAAFEEKVRFLATETSELRTLVRFLLPDSESYRAFIEQTRGSFDYQWAKLPQGAALLTDEAFKRSLASLVEQYSGLPPAWFAGKKVLDAGCGNGRWSYALCSLGAEVSAFDQSAAGVEATRAACASYPGFTCRRHDILEPLGMPGAFDLVWCYGVAHHTGNTWLAVRRVAEGVKEGGYLFLMIYGEPRWEEPGDFAELNQYVALRKSFRTMGFDERVAHLRGLKKQDEVHGWFDAVSPEINDCYRYDEIARWLHALGFGEIKLTMPSRNLHLIARRQGPAGRAPSSG